MANFYPPEPGHSWARPQSVFCEVWGGWSGGSCNSICNSFDKFLSSSLRCHTGYKGIFKPFQINFLISMIAGKCLFFTFIYIFKEQHYTFLPCRCWIDIFRFWASLFHIIIAQVYIIMLIHFVHYSVGHQKCLKSISGTMRFIFCEVGCLMSSLQ